MHGLKLDFHIPAVNQGYGAVQRNGQWI